MKLKVKVGYPISARDLYGGSDVVRDPKPVKGAGWHKSLRAARLYADQWATAWTKTRYPRCVTCGGAPEEWAHVLSGKGQAIRWEMFNMTRQCRRCNELHESHPEHLIKWFVETYGQYALGGLVAKGEKVAKLTYSQVMAVGDEYRSLCREGK